MFTLLDSDYRLMDCGSIDFLCFVDGMVAVPDIVSVQKQTKATVAVHVRGQAAPLTFQAFPAS